MTVRPCVNVQAPLLLCLAISVGLRCSSTPNGGGDGGLDAGNDGGWIDGGSEGIDGGNGACSVPAGPIRRLFEEAVLTNMLDALTVAAFDVGGHSRHYALSLVGFVSSPKGFTGFFDLPQPCTGPRVDMAICTQSTNPESADDAFWSTRDSCYRFSCEASNKEVVEVYITTRPHTAPDDRHGFSYPSEDPMGTATYEANPYVRWVLDRSGTDPLVVSGSIDRNVSLLLATGGQAINLRHSGSVVVTHKDANESDSLTMSLSFSGLAQEPVTVSLNLALAKNGALSATIDQGAKHLGTLTGNFGAGPPSFLWESSCP